MHDPYIAEIYILGTTFLLLVLRVKFCVAVIIIMVIKVIKIGRLTNRMFVNEFFTVTMCLPCIVSEIERFIGRKSPVYPPQSRLKPSQWGLPTPVSFEALARGFPWDLRY